MTATTAYPNPQSPPSPPPPGPPVDRKRPRRLLWNRFSPLQTLVVALATVAPTVIVAAVTANLAGVITVDEMMDVALAAGENPGMLTFGAMFLASPIQWLTGRSQVRVRKYLGIVFFLLALSNGAMFVIDEGLAQVLSAPFLVAGSLAVALAAPLFLTSSRWSQRAMGMKNWRLLHRLTYVVAAALLAHVALLGDPGPGAAMIVLGFVARIPLVRRALTARGAGRR